MKLALVFAAFYWAISSPLTRLHTHGAHVWTTVPFQEVPCFVLQVLTYHAIPILGSSHSTPTKRTVLLQHTDPPTVLRHQNVKLQHINTPCQVLGARRRVV